MENYEGGGDLTDIVRASGSTGNIQPEDWRFPSSDLMNFQPGIVEETTGNDDFGDPFSDLQDPLLQELNIGTSSSSFFFNSTTPISSSSTTTTNVTNIDRDQEKSCVFGSPQKMTMISLDDDQISPTTNSINNMTTMALQPVSPCDSSAASPRGSIIRASKVSIVDSTTCLQISSPPNPGNKRRKSQGKKVVCIPAPAPANSKCSGEIVPSDLWAWRKYGQKPIKGSPYPRGYYRCSSSKGCSARKQVERSRTDPNMLVITYTSEHNHPWPTQRNALAGSTRAQPSKSNAASQSQKPTNLKDQEFKESSNNKDINISSCNASVKEETEDIDEKELDIDEGGQSSEGFPSSYKPAMPGEDFFADLGEIEADPLSLFRSGGDDSERGIKDLDPFSTFDWPGNNNYTSFGEAKRGL